VWRGYVSFEKANKAVLQSRFSTLAVLRTLPRFHIKCSTVPFAHGANSVTLVCLNPNFLAKLANWCPENGGSLSVPILKGMPKSVRIQSIAGITVVAYMEFTISTAGYHE